MKIINAKKLKTNKKEGLKKQVTNNQKWQTVQYKAKYRIYR